MDNNAQINEEYSLSTEGTTRKKYGNIYGEDIMFQPVENVVFEKQKEDIPLEQPEDVEVSRCEKCGVAILDEDKLCIHCYKKRKIITIILFIVVWIAIAVLTDVLFGESFTFGSIFWFVLLPHLIKKDRFINKRRLFQSIPVTSEELTREIIRNPEFAEKCKKEYGLDDNLKLNNESLATPVQEHIYKHLKKCKSNLLSDYPQYLYFVNGVLPKDNIYENATITTQAKVPSTDTTPIYEGNKSNRQVSHNYKKSFVATIIALIIVSIVSVTTIAYQETIIQEKEESYANLKVTFDRITENQSNLRNEYNKLEKKYNSIMDEYEFYQYYAVCVNDDDPYYHSYSCGRFDSSSFWIYNIEAAKSKGYDACPVCRY